MTTPAVPASSTTQLKPLLAPKPKQAPVKPVPQSELIAQFNEAWTKSKTLASYTPGKTIPFVSNPFGYLDFNEGEVQRVRDTLVTKLPNDNSIVDPSIMQAGLKKNPKAAAYTIVGDLYSLNESRQLLAKNQDELNEYNTRICHDKGALFYNMNEGQKDDHGFDPGDRLELLHCGEAFYADEPDKRLKNVYTYEQANGIASGTLSDSAREEIKEAGGGYFIESSAKGFCFQ